MNYCSECGARVVSTWMMTDARARFVCGECGKIHFENPKILIACLAYSENGRVVMCRRAHEPARGLWVPPSGFVELGETLEAAVIREGREEAGICLASTELVPYGITSLPHLSEIYITFRAAIIAPQLTAGPESLEVKLFGEADAPWDELAFPGTAAFLRIFYQEFRTGRFSLHVGMRSADDRSRKAYRLSSPEGDVT